MRVLAVAVALLCCLAGLVVFWNAKNASLEGMAGPGGEAFSIPPGGVGAPVDAAGPAIDSQVVFLYYEDLEEASAFYGGVLDLAKTYDANGARIYRTSATSYIGLVAQGSGYHEVADEKPVMVSLVGNDVDAWHAKLAAAGVEILSEPADSGRAPVRAFLARDPGGYTIEFFAWLDR